MNPHHVQPAPFFLHDERSAAPGLTGGRTMFSLPHRWFDFAHHAAKFGFPVRST